MDNTIYKAKKENSTQAPSLLVSIARIITGVVFIFSGLIKANDPVGFSYKLQEYFLVLGVDFFSNYAVEIAVFICALEIVLGALLLLGLWRNVVAWGLLGLVVFFTFLTFYSAAFEVVKSCGCFGDAIPLTPWQSFIKDLVLLALILIIFRNRNNIRPVFADQYTSVITTVAIVLVSFGVGVYTVNYLPVVDFLPYKVGNNLPEQMRMPEGASASAYEITYTLRNKETGEEKKVSDAAYLEEEWWKNEAWEVTGEPESKLISQGYTVPIADFILYDTEGVDMTAQVLENPELNFYVVAWDLNASNRAGVERIRQLVTELATSERIRPVLLTSSSPELVDNFINETQLDIETFYVDAVPLKSMVRSNPGLLLMKEGTVIQKWHHHTVPNPNQFIKKFSESSID
jgi:uncharacterized membrane protein YphA (DoxX/SURF4 family)